VKYEYLGYFSLKLNETVFAYYFYMIYTTSVLESKIYDILLNSYTYQEIK